MAEKDKLKKEYIDRAKYWKNGADKSLIPGKEDIVPGFIYLWLSMNVIYNFYCKEDDAAESEKYNSALRKILNISYPIISAKDFYEENKMECRVLIEKKVNKNLNPLSQEELEEEKNAFNNKNETKKLIIIFGIIYRIRNNLFHGSKGSFGYKSRDQEVVQAAIPILKAFIENILIKFK